MSPDSPRLIQLLDFFEMVLNERMAGVPVLNANLCIEAVGFESSESKGESDPNAEGSDDLLAGYNGSIAEGVLITPWFMSLIRLPMTVMAGHRQTGSRFLRQFGVEEFDFLGNYDESVGYFESCALFSPMAEFDDQPLARKTAQHVLTHLRPEEPVTPPATSRRSFLKGRLQSTDARS